MVVRSNLKNVNAMRKLGDFFLHAAVWLVQHPVPPLLLLHYCYTTTTTSTPPHPKHLTLRPAGFESHPYSLLLPPP